MTVSWTLEGELTKLAGTSEIASALTILAIIDPDEDFVLDTVQDWYRSGAETYSLLFAVSNRSRRCEFMMKACVAYGFVPLSAHDWRSRGDDVVLIDFGQDLGPPGVGKGSEAGLLSEVLDSVDHAGIDLSPTELMLVSATYESSLSGQ